MKPIFKSVISVLLLVMVIFTIFVYPDHSDFYTYKDIESVRKTTQIYTIVVVIIIMTLVYLPKFLKMKNLNAIPNLLFSFLAITFGLSLLFGLLIFDLSLFLNRQKTISQINVTYTVITKTEKDNQYYVNWLFNYDTEEMIIDGLEVSQDDFMQLTEREDQVMIQFKQGWLGIKHSPQYLRQVQ